MQCKLKLIQPFFTTEYDLIPDPIEMHDHG